MTKTVRLSARFLSYIMSEVSTKSADQSGRIHSAKMQSKGPNVLIKRFAVYQVAFGNMHETGTIAETSRLKIARLFTNP